MKRLLALFLALGILTIAAPSLVDPVRADEKDEKKKDDKKKDDKPKTEKKLTDAQKEELKKLTGTFTLVNFERDGKKTEAAELKKMKVVQKGADWSFHLGDDVTQGKDTVYPDKSPKEIDSLYTNGPANGKTVKGIYKIEGDTITYCWAEPDKDRPKDFTSKAGENLTLMVLKRVKEEKSEGKEKKKDEAKDKDKKKDE